LIYGNNAHRIDVALLEHCCAHSARLFELVDLLASHHGLDSISNDAMLFIFEHTSDRAWQFARILVDAEPYKVPQHLFDSLMVSQCLREEHGKMLCNFAKASYLNISDQLLEDVVRATPASITNLQQCDRDSEALWRIAFEADGSLLAKMNKQRFFSEALVWTALRQNAKAAFPVITATPAMRAYALETFPELAASCADATDEELMKAIQSEPKSVLLIQQQRRTPAMKLEAVRLDHSLVGSIFETSDLQAYAELFESVLRANPLVVFKPMAALPALSESQELAVTEAAISRGWEYVDSTAEMNKPLCPLDRCRERWLSHCTCKPALSRFKTSFLCRDRVLQAFPQFITSTAFLFLKEQYLRAITMKPEVFVNIQRDLIQSMSVDVWNAAIELQPSNIRMLNHPPEDLQLEVVLRDHTNIQYIEKPCKSVMTFALMRDPTCTSLIKHDGGFAEKYKAALVPGHKKRSLSDSDPFDDLPEVSEAKRQKQ
jgi:hypothetical protein